MWRKTDVGQQYGIYYYGSPIIIKGAASWSLKHEANGKITIEKVDSEYPTQKIQGIQLKIYGKTDIGNGWIKPDKTLSSNYYDGDIFTTSSDGTVTIKDIPMGTYYIYEIGTGTAISSGYKLEDQRTIHPNYNDPNQFAGTQDHGNAVYLGELKLNSESKSMEGVGQLRQKRKINNKESKRK